MTKRSLSEFGIRYSCVVMLLWGLSAPWAAAGPVQDTELAEVEFARGDLVASLSLWRKAAEQGYAPAQARMGDMLDKAEEDDAAVEWYRKAAAQGNAAGEDGLGQMYAKGEGVKKDLEQARLYIEKAADKNYVPSLLALMDAYRRGGLGIVADAAKADALEARVIALMPSYKKTLEKPVVKAKRGNVR
jgi:TPR repeat protein